MVLQAITNQHFMIRKTCCTKWMSMRWSSAGYTAAAATFQSHTVSVLEHVFHSFFVMKNLSTKKNYWLLCDTWMSRCPRKVVCRFSLYFVHSLTCSSPSDLTTGCMTATLNFVFIHSQGNICRTSKRHPLRHSFFASFEALRGDPARLWEWKGPPLLCVTTLPGFAYYSGYTIKLFVRQDLVGPITVSKFVLFSFISFGGLVQDGTVCAC